MQLSVLYKKILPFVKPYKKMVIATLLLTFLGSFAGEDKILCIMQSGTYKLENFQLTNHFEEDMIVIEKWNPKKPISAVYWDHEKKQFNIKRFLVEETDRMVHFIPEEEGFYLELATTDWKPMLEIQYAKNKEGVLPEPETVNVEEFIAVKGLKAIGNRLTKDKVKHINLLESLPYEEPEEEYEDEEEETEFKPKTLFDLEDEQNNDEDKVRGEMDNEEE